MSFIQCKSLSLASADEIASKAIETAQAQNFKPISVCVLDSAGNPIVTKRMDGSAPAFAEIAKAKAATCIQVGMSSRTYGNKYISKEATPDTFVKLLNQIMIQDGKVACFQGGIRVICKESGCVVGAVGASGAAGDEDEYCCLMGVQQSSIGSLTTTDPPTHSCKTLKK